MQENKTRSIAKVLSWRLIGIVFWPSISYIITGNWIETGLLTTAFLFMTVMYYVHERIWNRIKWGRLDSNDGSR